jgi:hypothetical protein
MLAGITTAPPGPVYLLIITPLSSSFVSKPEAVCAKSAAPHIVRHIINAYIFFMGILLP